MSFKKFAKIFFIILLFLISFYVIFLKYFKNKEVTDISNQNEEVPYNSNIL